jgi:hypothetical protein
MIPDPVSISADDLAERCAAKSFRKPQQGVADAADRYCFELLRRAFGREDDACLAHVLRLFRDRWSRLWIRNPTAFERHPLTADDFTSMTFAKVYRLYRGEKFAAFDSFGPFLAYLRKALVRTIAEYNRSAMSQQARTRSDSDTDDLELFEQIAGDDRLQDEVEDKLLWQQIERRVEARLPDEKDRFFFDCWAKYDLSRAEIVREFRRRWPDDGAAFDENAVRVALQRLRRHLLRDATLLSLLQEYRGGPTPPNPPAD